MSVERLRLRRDPTGLYDLEAHHPVGLDRLADHVRSGGTFTAVAHDTGVDCTRLVLADLLRHHAGGQSASMLAQGLAALWDAGTALLPALLDGGSDGRRPRRPNPAPSRPGGRERRERTAGERWNQQDGVVRDAD